MSGKPSYLGLLNAIAVGERHGNDFLSRWADATQDPDLASVLNFVAIREQEHCAAFTKRICELGYTVRPAADDQFEDRLALAGSSDVSDRKKFKKLLGISKKTLEKTKDPFGRLFEDTTIDAQTGALLGRYVAEERDSGRRLRNIFCTLFVEGAHEDLDDIRQRLDKLTRTLEELKEYSASRRAARS